MADLKILQKPKVPAAVVDEDTSAVPLFDDKRVFACKKSDLGKVVNEQLSFRYQTLHFV